MANAVIGHVTCPFCHNESATVHRQAKGGKLYYRCYEADGSSRCRTAQITGPTGQEWIEAHMRPLDHGEQDQAVVEAGEAAQAEALAAVRGARRQVRQRSKLAELADSLLAPGEDDQ